MNIRQVTSLFVYTLLVSTAVAQDVTSEPSIQPSGPPSLTPSVPPSSVPTAPPTKSSSPPAPPSVSPSNLPSGEPTLAATIDPDTIAGFILNDGRLNKLSSALNRAGFIEPLASPGTVTCFAALDSAFAVIPDVFMTLLFENDAFLPHLRVLLLHSLLPTNVFAADFNDNTNVTALSGESVLVNTNPLRVNSILINEADNGVSNGVVHIMDDVLAPSWVFKSLADRLGSDAEISIFNTFLTSVGLNLSVLGEYTLLAPTNDGVNALGQEVLTVLSDPLNADLLIQVLIYHILPGNFFFDDFKPARIDTFQGGFVTVAVNPVRFNGATVVEADILANNGVLHKINTLILFADGVRGNTILDFVADSPNTSKLFGALQRSAFDGPLAQPGSLTLFAPTDEAFAVLPPAFLQLLFTNDEFFPHLQNLLLYHLLPTEIFANQFVSGTAYGALNGEKLGARTATLAFNGVKVAVSDNDVDNGVVHTVKGILAPSWVFNSLGSRVAIMADISILGSFFVLAEINLNAQTALTLLAPTNDAFLALGEAFVETLVEDPVARNTLLSYHLVVGVFTSFQLSVDSVLPNVSGTELTVTSKDPITFDDAPVFFIGEIPQVDFLSTNGVLHKISAVLTPQ
jgi:uncharacterized surface protein with fasciclin (FAS1) repeats